MICVGENAHAELPKTFSGNFGEIRAKIFLTPKNLPSTPTLWFTMSCAMFCLDYNAFSGHFHCVSLSFAFTANLH